MNKYFKYCFLLSILFSILGSSTAQITSGKIVYERKTNMFKKYKNENIKNLVKADEKVKIDAFELYFNDSISLFRKQVSDLKDDYSFLRSQNTVSQNFKKNNRLTIKKIMEEDFYEEDTLRKREWKITDAMRNISGYVCQKAIWQADDSTRIYAWYTEEIIPSVGPESFYGLPGAILGLATEDGGVIYFAISVEVLNPDFKTLAIKKGKNKIYTPKELKVKIQKNLNEFPEGKVIIKDNFGIW